MPTQETKVKRKNSLPVIWAPTKYGNAVKRKLNRI